MSSLDDHQHTNEDDSLQQSLLSQPVSHGDSINNVNAEKEDDTHPLEKIRKRSSGTISTIFSIINTMVVCRKSVITVQICAVVMIELLIIVHDAK